MPIFLKFLIALQLSLRYVKFLSGCLRCSLICSYDYHYFYNQINNVKNISFDYSKGKKGKYMHFLLFKPAICFMLFIYVCHNITMFIYIFVPIDKNIDYAHHRQVVIVGIEKIRKVFSFPPHLHLIPNLRMKKQKSIRSP